MSREPAMTAWLDQFRAYLAHALLQECTCGECPSDEEIRALIALSDTQLEFLLDSILFVVGGPEDG